MAQDKVSAGINHCVGESLQVTSPLTQVHFHPIDDVRRFGSFGAAVKAHDDQVALCFHSANQCLRRFDVIDVIARSAGVKCDQRHFLVFEGQPADRLRWARPHDVVRIERLFRFATAQLTKVPRVVVRGGRQVNARGLEVFSVRSWRAKREAISSLATFCGSPRVAQWPFHIGERQVRVLQQRSHAIQQMGSIIGRQFSAWYRSTQHHVTDRADSQESLSGCGLRNDDQKCGDEHVHSLGTPAASKNVIHSADMSELRLRVLQSVSEVSRSAWNALLKPADAPVLRWEWIRAMEASGSAAPERGWEPTHFTLWRGEQLAAAAPAYRKHHSMGEYVYDFGWANAAAQLGIAYYPKLLVGLPLSPLTARRVLVNSEEDETNLRRALMEALTKYAQREGCSSVHVLFPPEDEARDIEASGFFHRSTMQFHWHNPGYRTYDDYLSRFDSKRRNQFKRERAAAASQGITLRTVRSGELETRHAELAWRFYEATASRHAWGPVQLTQDFFHRVFADMPDAIELVVAERSGQVIAGAFNLHTASRLYGRYWGCFEEHPFLHFHVCLYHSVDDAIRRGLEAFEPGAGGEHKISRGFEPTEIHSVHRIFHSGLERAVKDFCNREQQQVERVTSDSAHVAGLKPWPANHR